jgi:hypothetical protein
MGSDCFIVFYGIRYSFENSNEVENNLDNDTKILDIKDLAKSVGLREYLAIDEKENQQLFIGQLISVSSAELLDDEYTYYKSLPDEELQNIMADVKKKLKEANITETPMLHMQLQPDYYPPNPRLEPTPARNTRGRALAVGQGSRRLESSMVFVVY